MSAKVKTIAKSTKGPKKALSPKAPFTLNGHRIKWSLKWKGWEVYKGKKLVQMCSTKDEARIFAKG